MSIKFGWETSRVSSTAPEVDPFNGAPVLILKPLEGRRRKILFSAGASEALGLYHRTNGLEEQPEFTGTTLSIASEELTSSKFIFVNDNNFPDIKQISINKIEHGFSDKEIYESIANMFSLDMTKENHIMIEPYNQTDVNANLFKISGVYAPQQVESEVV